MNRPPTDEELEQAAERALGIWQNGTNDDVWDAIFEDINVAAEMLTRIENTPDFTVGDLTHEQVIAAILRRYPILGPNPRFGA